MVLVSDDDDHWYIIPATKVDDWNEWKGVEAPKYARAIDGPHSVMFESYQPFNLGG